MDERWWPGLTQQVAKVAWDDKQQRLIRAADPGFHLPLWMTARGPIPPLARVCSAIVGATLGWFAGGLTGWSAGGGALVGFAILSQVTDSWYLWGARRLQKGRAESEGS